MNKVLIITILTILLVPCLIYFAGSCLVANQIRDEVRRLQSSVEPQQAKTYHEDQLQGLPEPVQRYFKYSLQNGQPYISSVYLKHDGQFKTALDRNWIPIKGEQHFTIEKPGFLWKGRTLLFTVWDAFISGKGEIKVFLLNLFKVVDGEGPEYDQGELLRWLGESVWFPTNLLPSTRLQWTAINGDEAKLTFHYKDQILNYKVSFNEKGEITQLETQRYMGNENLETWIGRVSDYEEVNGMKIPMRIEAFWKLSDGEHSYAQFTIRDIHHN
ncbi:MAG: hypothetical protein ISR78_06090 [Spirochaetia bacterium]|nr:hypothetical protein [Spirochaetia bacterium]